MAALTTDRNTPARDLKVTVHPVKAGVVLHGGAICALEVASGMARPATTATGLRGLGRVQKGVDNSTGGDGDAEVEVWRGCFRWANDGTDTVDRTHIGAPAYAVDDQTVAATDAAGTRSAIGTIRDVDASGVWVEI